MTLRDAKTAKKSVKKRQERPENRHKNLKIKKNPLTTTCKLAITTWYHKARHDVVSGKLENLGKKLQKHPKNGQKQQKDF